MGTTRKLDKTIQQIETELQELERQFEALKFPIIQTKEFLESVEGKLCQSLDKKMLAIFNELQQLKQQRK